MRVNAWNLQDCAGEQDEALARTPGKRLLEPQSSPEKSAQPCWERRLRLKTKVELPVPPELLKERRGAEEWFGHGEQGNPLGKCYGREEKPNCVFRGVEKHQAKWMTRRSGQGNVKANGGVCYSCGRSCSLLKLPRNAHIFSAVPRAQRLMLLKSWEIRSSCRLLAWTFVVALIALCVSQQSTSTNCMLRLCCFLLCSGSV